MKKAVADPTLDFAHALKKANAEMAPEEVGLPGIFPESREHEEIPAPEKEKSPPSAEMDTKDYHAKYRRFDLADPADITKLEKINDHIMHDGWLPGREEWIHTRDGGTYVVLKWLECTKSKRKRTPEQAEFDAVAETLKEFGIEP